jgi:putative ABC transport system permease protein
MIPIAYNLRSLAVRKATTVAAALGLALVVFMLAGAFMLSNGIRKTVGRAGVPGRALVMRNGSDSEMTSAIDEPTVGVVLSAPGIARRENGAPDGVGELLVVVLLNKVGTTGFSNVQIRGVTPDSFRLRPEVKFVSGRAPRPGNDEVAVGQAIRGRFRGTELGGSFEIKKDRPVTVVGVFSSEGSALESEVWADLDTVRTAFGRPGLVSSVRARLESPSQFDGFRTWVAENRQLGMTAQRETTYYEKQSAGTALFVRAIGTVVVFFCSIGAMMGATITMYASIASRRREIGTLRAIGFSRSTIVSSFLMESVILALAGGLVGAIASLSLRFVHFSMINFASWSEMVFSFEPTSSIVAGSLVASAGMGIIGGLLPAIRAARMSPMAAIRD